MDVVVRPCTPEDLASLERAGVDGRSLGRHRERHALQANGEGWHLLAWEGERVVGQATVTRQSKYETVRSVLGVFPEINGVAANPRGLGIGTRLIRAAEGLVSSEGATRIGLAVEHANGAARRLYERLGYEDWGHGPVVDEWAERDDDGGVVAVHRDPCAYLVRAVTATARRPSTSSPSR